MKRSKSLWHKTIFLLMIAVTCCPVSAFANTSGTVTNEGFTGAVDIKLNYEMDAETTVITPNQNVGLKSSVTNSAEPAWVRTRIQYPVYANNETVEHLTEENMTELDDALVTFADKNWIRIGPYYYLTKPIKQGETVDFTESIRFPADWDNRMVDSKFGICITVEAIQEKNFTPDFKSDDPWHGAVIETFDATDYVRRGEGTERFSIQYEGGAENIIHISDNFFTNWDYVMPGDTLTGEADIENKMQRPIRLFFGIKSVLKNKDVDESLLKQLHLTIRHNGKAIYDDDLTGNLKETLLKEYAPNEAGTLDYTLKAPASMDNEYAQKVFKTIWTFRAEVVPEEVVTPDTPAEIIKEIVKTGDIMTPMHLAAIGILLIISSGIGIYFMKVRGRKK